MAFSLGVCVYNFSSYPRISWYRSILLKFQSLTTLKYFILINNKIKGEKMTKYCTKKSRLFFTIITTLLISIMCVATIKAHSPSSMSISYDIEAKTIEAAITHTVSDPDAHFVNKIEVRINDELFDTFQYTSQPGTSFTHSLDLINASVGDKIEVKAYCNQGGQITKQLTVSEENGKSTNGDDSTPGFEILLFVAALVMVLTLIKNKIRKKEK